MLTEDTDLNEDFLDILNIETKKNWTFLTKIIKGLKAKGMNSKDTYKKLYELFLEYSASSESEEREIIQEFQENRLIYVSKSDHFFSGKELIWEDTHNVIPKDSKYAALKEEYPNLETFFNRIEITLDSLMKHFYSNVLSELAQKGAENLELTKNIKNKLLRIYKYSPNEIFYDTPLLAKNKEGLSFYKERNNLYINDDNTLFNLFKDKKDLYFLVIPDNAYPELRNFSEETCIDYLSYCVTEQVLSVQDPTKVSDIEDTIKNNLDFIERYIYHKHNEIFDIGIKKKVFSLLHHINVFSLPNLKVKYTIRDKEQIDKADFYYYKEENSILIHQEALEKDNTYFSIAELIEKLIIDKIKIELEEALKFDLSSFISLLFTLDNKKKIEQLLSSKNIGDIPISVKETIKETERDEKEIEEGEETDKEGEDTEKKRKKKGEIKGKKEGTKEEEIDEKEGISDERGGKIGKKETDTRKEVGEGEKVEEEGEDIVEEEEIVEDEQKVEDDASKGEEISEEEKKKEKKEEPRKTDIEPECEVKDTIIDLESFNPSNLNNPQFIRRRDKFRV